jgi:hypothetical protein
VSLLIAILTLVMIGLVVLAVGGPLRDARRAGDDGAPASGSAPDAVAIADPFSHERQELEAAREAKYREIRDAELDFRTGKLSREDYNAIDADLRAEAIEILDRIESDDAESDDAGRSGPGEPSRSGP